MANLIIRNFEESLITRLRLRAATNGRSMESEANALLRAALTLEDSEAKGLGSAINALFRPMGGIDDIAPLRGEVRPEGRGPSNQSDRHPSRPS